MKYWAMKSWAMAATLLAASLLLGTEASAQSRRDYYDERGRLYQSDPYYDTYDRRGVRRNDRTIEEQEAYERGRADQRYREQQRREAERRNPSLGEQLGDMIDRQTQR